MTIILAGVRSLADHLRTIEFNPEVYRPKHCPTCAGCTLWGHGCYTRKADRQDLGAPCLNPVPILRFICPRCRATCSVLPEVIPPRRWYLWTIQQSVLMLLLAGGSYYHASERHDQHPVQQTIRRWWQRLKEQFEIHASILRPSFPCLGRAPFFNEFWKAGLALQPLSTLMTQLHHDGVAVP